MTVLRLPDFIIAGAPRCGTTWLYTVADRHSVIEMAKPVTPEPKFFLRDDLFARGLAYYSTTWFAELPAECLIGEKSTNYLESPTAARRIHDSLPRVRLIFLLRNPVDRAYSNYLWSKQNGLETESFARALELEPQRERSLPESLRYARPFSYFSRGLYAAHLERFLGLFPREQVLVVRTEDVVSDPEAVARHFQEFLGVEVEPGLANGLGAVNAVVSDGTAPLSDELRGALAERYREPNQHLCDLLGTRTPLW